MIFDENTYGLELLKSSSSLSYSDPFGIVEDTGLTIPLMCILTNSLTFVLESIGSQRTLNNIVKSPNHTFEENGTLVISYLP